MGSKWFSVAVVVQSAPAMSSVFEHGSVLSLSSDRALPTISMVQDIKHAKKGSSRKSGKISFDLEKEVVVIAEAISHSFDDLDAVVDAFDNTGVERMGCAGNDGVDVRPQLFGKQNQWFNGTFHCLLEPYSPTPFASFTPGGCRT